MTDASRPQVRRLVTAEAIGFGILVVPFAVLGNVIAEGSPRGLRLQSQHQPRQHRHIRHDLRDGHLSMIQFAHLAITGHRAETVRDHHLGYVYKVDTTPGRTRR